MTPVSISIIAITGAAMASMTVAQAAPRGAATSVEQQARPTSTQSDSVGADSAGALVLPQTGGDSTVPTPREQLSGDDFNVGKSRIYNFIYFVVALAIGAGAFMAVRLFASYRRRKAQSESMPLMLVPKPVNAPLITNEFPLQTNHDAPRPQPAGGNSNHSGESVAVRMPKPPDGTLQLLPGRFEIASGNDRMKEIRFVKTPGPAVVTFGRYAGEGHSHVQVDSPTVSRMHARMRFEGGRWHIANLSATNPVVLNGEPLPADGNEQVLNDKDQVEMGEVVFRFRAR